MGDAKAPTILGASALRFGQLEPGLAPVIKRLTTLTFYWGVGGRMRTACSIYCVGRALAEVLVEALVELFAELLQSFCRASYGGLCRAFVELRTEVRAELL